MIKESEEERAARLTKRVDKRKEKLSNETEEERAERLSKQVSKREKN